MLKNHNGRLRSVFLPLIVLIVALTWRQDSVHAKFKVWREIKRVANDGERAVEKTGKVLSEAVKDGTKLLTELGEEGEKLLCGGVLRRPGEGCNVNGTVSASSNGTITVSPASPSPQEPSWRDYQSYISSLEESGFSESLGAFNLGIYFDANYWSIPAVFTSSGVWRPEASITKPNDASPKPRSESMPTGPAPKSFSEKVYDKIVAITKKSAFKKTVTAILRIASRWNPAPISIDLLWPSSSIGDHPAEHDPEGRLLKSGKRDTTNQWYLPPTEERIRDD